VNDDDLLTTAWAHIVLDDTELDIDCKARIIGDLPTTVCTLPRDLTQILARHHQIAATGHETQPNQKETQP